MTEGDAGKKRCTGDVYYMAKKSKGVQNLGCFKDAWSRAIGKYHGATGNDKKKCADFARKEGNNVIGL
jgi:hypothetical protein